MIKGHRLSHQCRKEKCNRMIDIELLMTMRRKELP
jgi:hypothetical protein